MSGRPFIANTPERRAVGNLLATICDNYIAALQPHMYETYDSGVDRAPKVLEMSSAFDAIEVALDATGPYVAGSEGSGGCCPSRRIKGHRTPARLRGLGTSAD
jgi:hypothetical protein